MTAKTTTPIPAKRAILLLALKGAGCFSVDGLESPGKCVLTVLETKPLWNSIDFAD